MQDIVLISIPATTISYLIEEAVKKALKEAGVLAADKAIKSSTKKREVLNV